MTLSRVGACALVSAQHLRASRHRGIEASRLSLVGAPPPGDLKTASTSRSHADQLPSAKTDFARTRWPRNRISGDSGRRGSTTRSVVAAAASYSRHLRSMSPFLNGGTDGQRAAPPKGNAQGCGHRSGRTMQQSIAGRIRAVAGVGRRSVGARTGASSCGTQASGGAHPPERGRSARTPARRVPWTRR